MMRTMQSRKGLVLEEFLLKEVLQNDSESFFKGSCYLWRVRTFSREILVELILEE